MFAMARRPLFDPLTYNGPFTLAPRVTAPPTPVLSTARSYGGDVNQQFDQALGYSRQPSQPSGPMANLMQQYNDSLGYGGMSRR